MLRTRRITGSDEERLLGRRFVERYLVLSRIESGGKRFYRAMEEISGRFVTLALVDGASPVHRLHGVEHVALVAVLESGPLPGDRAYVVLEPFEGMTVAEAGARGEHLGPDDAMAVLVHLAAALSVLAQRGLGLVEVSAAEVYLVDRIPKLMPLRVHRGASPATALVTLARILLGAPADSLITRAAATAPTPAHFTQMLLDAVS